MPLTLTMKYKGVGKGDSQCEDLRNAVSSKSGNSMDADNKICNSCGGLGIQKILLILKLIRFINHKTPAELGALAHTM